jgi:hypothetical protein
MNRHPRPPEVVPAALVTLGLLLSGCTSSSDSGATPAGTRPAASTPSGPSDPPSAAPQHLFDVSSPASLAPGTYQFSVAADTGVDNPEALVEVPSGFNSGSDFYVVSSDSDAFLGLWAVVKVQHDACLRPAHDSFTPGPSVEALATALVTQKSTRAAAPKPVTLAGYQGLYVELASPHDISKCDKYPTLWDGRGIYGDDQVDRVWIVDVDGQRVVVNTAYGPTSTASEREKLTSMVKSLTFVAAH